MIAGKHHRKLRRYKKAIVKLAQREKSLVYSKSLLLKQRLEKLAYKTRARQPDTKGPRSKQKIFHRQSRFKFI